MQARQPPGSINCETTPDSSELAAERCAAPGRRSAFVSHAVSGVCSEEMHPPKHVSADRRRHLIGDLTGHAAHKQDVQADK